MRGKAVSVRAPAARPRCRSERAHFHTSFPLALRGHSATLAQPSATSSATARSVRRALADAAVQAFTRTHGVQRQDQRPASASATYTGRGCRSRRSEARARAAASRPSRSRGIRRYEKGRPEPAQRVLARLVLASVRNAGAGNGLASRRVPGLVSEYRFDA